MRDNGGQKEPKPLERLMDLILSVWVINICQIFMDVTRECDAVYLVLFFQHLMHIHVYYVSDVQLFLYYDKSKGEAGIVLGSFP